MIAVAIAGELAARVLYGFASYFGANLLQGFGH
jgi:hypothetical protein